MAVRERPRVPVDCSPGVPLMNIRPRNNRPAGPLITFFTWAKSEVTQISRRQCAQLSFPISREPSNSFNENGRAVEGLSSKKSSPHPHAPPPRRSAAGSRGASLRPAARTSRGGTLVVPSRCSIFRAFRYFPINRRTRERVHVAHTEIPRNTYTCTVAPVQKPARARAYSCATRTRAQRVSGAHTREVRYALTRAYKPVSRLYTRHVRVHTKLVHAQAHHGARVF